MAKLLLTGMKKLGVVPEHYKRQQLQVIPSGDSLAACLVDMGHEVIVAPYHEGNEEYFDHAFILLDALSSQNSTYALEGLQAVLAFKGRCTLRIDDWMCPQVLDGLAKAAREPRTAISRWANLHKVALQEADERQATKALELLQEAHPLLLPCFSGGNPSLLVPPRVPYTVLTYNPEPYGLHRTWEDPTGTGTPRVTEPRPDKLRRANYAVLSKANKAWLQGKEPPTWPVIHYGCKATGDTRLTEDELVRVFTEDWLTLQCGYKKHSGSGWWRARPRQAANAYSILITDPAEARIYYGPDHPFCNLTAADLEQCSDEDLLDIAIQQHEDLNKLHPLDKAVQQAQLELTEALV